MSVQILSPTPFCIIITVMVAAIAVMVAAVTVKVAISKFFEIRKNRVSVPNRSV